MFYLVTGLLFYIPFLDVCHKVDIRLKMLKVPSHSVISEYTTCYSVVIPRICVHPVVCSAGGDERPGVHRGECSVLLPHWEHVCVLLIPGRSPGCAAGSGSGVSQGGSGPSHLYQHTAEQEWGCPSDPGTLPICQKPISSTYLSETKSNTPVLPQRSEGLDLAYRKSAIKQYRTKCNAICFLY